MICQKCKIEKEKNEFSKFNPKLCRECFHHTDSWQKYLKYLDDKKPRQFPFKGTN